MMTTRPIDGRALRIGFALGVLSALLATAFPSSAQSDAQEWPDTVVVIGDPNADHGSGYQEWGCAGEQFALVVADYPGCGDFGGEHVLDQYYMIFGFRSVHAGNYGPIPLTGTLRAEVEFEDGYGYWFDCSWDQGVFRGCTITIPPMFPVGVPFQFECYSLEGAIGGWSECFIGHG